MKKGPIHFSTQHQRQAGRKRAAQFDRSSLSENGKKRATQLSNDIHLQGIAADGFWAQSAYLRGRSGLRLLAPDQVHFLRPEDLVGSGGTRLDPREQRLYFGVLVWQSTWQDLPAKPPMPSDEEYLQQVKRVQSSIGVGIPLEHVLDGVYTAPDDFCDTHGNPWSARKQRKLFRDALRQARAYAMSLSQELKPGAPPAMPGKAGRRRPMQALTPVFQRGEAPVPKGVYGRPDLPRYDHNNIFLSRPYGIPPTNDSFPMFSTIVAPSIEEFCED
jgi:hypothetical protein